MNRTITIACILLGSLLASMLRASGQEFVAPLRYNPVLHDHPAPACTAKKTTATLSLPFFEDFTGYSIYPDTNKWVDYEVYINNTICASPVSRGVATFDALNSVGIPYDSFSNTDFRYCDSLTSQPIDLSADSSADSIYFSFFYQPQGTSYYPLPADSLMLYFKDKYGGFIKVWGVAGTTLQPFQQVMIPITDSLYFHNSFQFRFVNIAASYWADAIWNVDYIKLDKNRSAGDTTVGDVAFSSDPGFLLNDYTAMPYYQFMANPAGEIVSQVSDSIRNDTSFSQAVPYNYELHDLASGASLFTAGFSNVFLPGYLPTQVSPALSIAPYPAYPRETRVVFESKFYLQSASSTGPTANDTIVKQQVFDNYLAYDDGTAEKSYYLNLFPTLPGKIAIEYHLNEPDTMRGMAIYFGRQIPFATYKIFSIYVYSALAGINGAFADIVLDSQELYSPAYLDTVNHFCIYTFSQPLILPAGTFYAGTLQPAQSASDSLYIGLDVNRIGGNHAYYNVLGEWSPSLISGAIMMRPLLGQYVAGTGVSVVPKRAMDLRLTPNPVRDMLQFRFDGDAGSNYQVLDMQGRVVMQGQVSDGGWVDIAPLMPGVYFVKIFADGSVANVRKIIKI